MLGMPGKIKVLKALISILLNICLVSCSHGADTGGIYYDHATMVRKGDENVWVKCPAWDWERVPPECRMPGWNCVPVCGKWPGDKVDIGAWQYVPGITSEKPWGDWEGIPFKSAPGEGPKAPEKFRIAPPPAPFDLKIIGVKID